MNEEIDIEEWAPGFVFLITLIGGFLRLFLLGSKGLWLDETFSIWVASHNIADMLQWVIKIDQHPPLYYLLLHYWINYNGDTSYYVRLFSALCSTATIPVIYLIGKRIADATVGLAAAVFLSFSLFNIYFAQEARMYALLTFNAAIAIYALARLLTDSRSTRNIGSQFKEYLIDWRANKQVTQDIKQGFSYKTETNHQGWWWQRRYWPPIQTIETDLAWIVFIVFSSATLLTHGTAVFFAIATNVFVLGLILSQKVKKPGETPAFHAPSGTNWIKSQIGIFVLWSPWLLVFIKQVSKVDRDFWIPKPDWNTVAQTFRALLNPSTPSQASQIVVWALCAVLFLGLIFFRKKFPIALFLITLFAVPFLGELIVSIRRPIFLDKTLIWLTIPLFLLLAAGIAQLRFRFLIVMVLGLFAANHMFAISDYYRFFQKEDWATAAGYVAKFAEKDDLVLFNSNFIIIPFDYYFKQYEDLYLIQVNKRGVPLDLFGSGVLEPKMTTDDISGLVSLLHGHKRVWLVYSHNDYTDPNGLIPQTIASQMKLVQTREFYGGQIQLYEIP